ncbi:hypothetical protein QYM36_017368 [Artemia franciscana]|uniref:Uncharacterized protein n=1 Tax=Artemia franciscana TaxID=6661 RepID=A0AA88HH94_ARTSF|nr:hypothetical protein QYM36_017368 [Artemia franciscana]
MGTCKKLVDMRRNMLSPPCGGVEQPGEILERRKIDDFKKLDKGFKLDEEEDKKNSKAKREDSTADDINFFRYTDWMRGLTLALE